VWSSSTDNYRLSIVGRIRIVSEGRPPDANLTIRHDDEASAPIFDVLCLEYRDHALEQVVAAGPRQTHQK